MAVSRCAVFLIAAIAAVSAYNPDTDNVYHLFTRANPTVSQPILLNNDNLLLNSNFNGGRPTVLLIHGFLGSATAPINSVLVPAYLQAADVNVVVVDWSAGAQTAAASTHAIPAGMSVARFIDWVILRTTANIGGFTLVAHSLGVHLSGVTGRSVTSGRIPYIVGLDPGGGMGGSEHIFGPDAAIYSECIHTNADVMGHGSPIAHVDFFPNGGDLMPGCGINFLCNHDRAIHYFGESVTNGGFLGRSCATLAQARLGLCLGALNTRMGGISPKTGSSGIFHVSTNAASPFSQGG